jgi:hypothetical protein
MLTLLPGLLPAPQAGRGSVTERFAYQPRPAAVGVAAVTAASMVAVPAVLVRGPLVEG